MSQKLSFEYCMEKIEEISNRLESGEETLEASLKLYQEAMSLISNCKNLLKNAEQKLTVVGEYSKDIDKNAE